MRRLILRGIDRSQIVGALVGCFLGFTVLLTGAQLYFDLKNVLGEEGDIWKPGYYVINKKVSMLDNVLGGTGFDPSDIEEIEEKAFVEDLAPFHTSSFQISAQRSEGDRTPGLSTQLFFEALPDRFMDIDTGEWHWNQESEELPIVVPSHYIALYNFGFARSQGLPRISKNMVSQVSFRVRVHGNGRSRAFKSRIVAFSDRINSILVPLDFLKWANERFGEGEDPEPSRLMVRSKDPSAGELFSFAEEKNYEIQGGNERTGRLSSLLNIGVGIVGSTAAFIILLAAWLLIISFRLLIIKNRETIKKLHLLGYDLHLIGRVYLRIMALFSGVVLIAASLGTILLRRGYVPLFEASGFEMGGWSYLTFLIAFGVIFLINGVNKLLIDRQLRVSVEE
jgi:hypothetical protein